MRETAPPTSKETNAWIFGLREDLLAVNPFFVLVIFGRWGYFLPKTL